MSKVEKKIDYKLRLVPDVVYPPNYFPKEEELFKKDGNPNYDVLIPHFQKEGRINPTHAIKIVNMAAEVMRKEPNLLVVQDPITEIGGPPSKTPYLFLGDYVDRGMFGMEVILLLLSYKINYPDTFYMLRGNHECRHLSAYFNFKKECLYKYNEEVYDAIMNCFDCLPLACVLNDKFLCVHGGISPDILTLEDINSIDRFQEPPSSGPMCDLIWSDPMEDDEEDEDDEYGMFQFNELRNCSYTYSYTAVSTFLANNNLLSVFRAHEVQDEGYKLYKRGKDTNFPTVIYCDSYGNMGAIIRFVNNAMNIRQFKWVDHPYYLPNFMNVFTWSIPFVGDKVQEVFKQLWNMSASEEDDEIEKIEPIFPKDQAEVIKAKIMTIGRMARMYERLKHDKETINQLKEYNEGLIPTGLLIKGTSAMKSALKRFDEAKAADKINELNPSSIGQETKKSGSFAGKSAVVKGLFKNLQQVERKQLDSPSIVVGEKTVVEEHK